MELIFFISTVCDMQRRKNIAQLFICKGEKIANDAYLENIADFYESYKLYNVKWVGLIIPGHPEYPRTPQVTPRYPRTHLIFYIIHLFIHSDENKAKTASNSFHFKCIASKRSYLTLLKHHKDTTETNK